MTETEKRHRIDTITAAYLANPPPAIVVFADTERNVRCWSRGLPPKEHRGIMLAVASLLAQRGIDVPLVEYDRTSYLRFIRGRGLSVGKASLLVWAAASSIR